MSWLICLSAATVLHAQTNANTNTIVRPLSLDESIDQALKHNLDVQIEQYNPLFERYRLKIAYAAWEPAFSASATHSYASTPSGTLDPQGRLIPASRSEVDSINASLGGPGVGVSGLLPSGLQYSLSGNTADSVFHRPDLNGVYQKTENTRGSIALNMQQPLLKNFWIDDTRKSILVEKNRIKYTELGVRQLIMKVVNDVSQAYYELIFARENIKVQQAALELAERLVAENRKRVQVGTLAPLDEKQAESQAAASKADLLTAQNTANSQENILKGLMTDDYTKLHDTQLMPTEVLAAPIPLLNLQDSWSKGMTQRPDLLQSRLDIEQQKIFLRYDYNQLFPQLDLRGSYGFSGAGTEFSGALDGIRTGSDPNYSFGAVLTIPLGNRAARSTYKSDLESKKQLLLRLKKLEETILIDIDNAVKQVRNAFERVDATRQARVYAETALDAEQKKLESGKSTSFNVLQFQRDLTARRSDEIRALADFNKALSQLYFLEGSSLDRGHIRVEVK